MALELVGTDHMEIPLVVESVVALKFHFLAKCDYDEHFDSFDDCDDDEIEIHRCFLDHWYW